MVWCYETRIIMSYCKLTVELINRNFERLFSPKNFTIERMILLYLLLVLSYTSKTREQCSKQCGKEPHKIRELKDAFRCYCDEGKHLIMFLKKR